MEDNSCITNIPACNMISLNRLLTSKSIFQNLCASATVYTELSKNEYQLGTGVLLKTSHKMGTGPWNIIAQYQYDALGRVQRKGLGATQKCRTLAIISGDSSP